MPMYCSRCGEEPDFDLQLCWKCGENLCEYCMPVTDDMCWKCQREEGVSRESMVKEG